MNIFSRSLTSSQTGQTPGHGTPHQSGGISSYSRNSLIDCMPIPSVGSPGTPAASPHPNSALSQPTSVPPADQVSLNFIYALKRSDANCNKFLLSTFSFYQ